MEKKYESMSIYLSCDFSFVSDNDFILWIELVFQSFKGNKDFSKRVVLVWKIEKLNYSSFTWWELYVIEWDTICKKAIKRGFAGENSQKGLSVHVFEQKLFPFNFFSFWVFTKKWNDTSINWEIRNPKKHKQ